MKTDKLFKSYTKEHTTHTESDASDLILKKINEDKPLMIARFGAVELSCIINHIYIKGTIFSNILNVLNGYSYFLKFNNSVKYSMTNNAGFFPSNEADLRKFSELYLKCAKDIDILVSWMKHETFIESYLSENIDKIFLDDLDSFRHANPWTEALKDKKVLVIHPFEDSIQSQYKRHELLFKDNRVLPKFELITIKAVQTIGGKGDNKFQTWFEALEYMIKKVEKIDFDIALIGAGAYGLPLASAIKNMGKKAIHVGGSLQCLFGIKGARWEDPIYDYNNKYYNKYWIRPLESEKPKTADKVENACYW